MRLCVFARGREFTCIWYERRQTRLLYDLYISYHSQDQRWVDGYVLPQLDAVGFHTAINHRITTFNEPYWTSIERAVQHSRHILIVITPSWVAEEWVAFERMLKRTHAPEERLYNIVLLVLQPADLPQRLATLPCIDFTNEEQWKDHMIQLLLTLGLPDETESTAATATVPTATDTPTPMPSKTGHKTDHKTDHKTSRKPTRNETIAYPLQRMKEAVRHNVETVFNRDTTTQRPNK